MFGTAVLVDSEGASSYFFPVVALAHRMYVRWLFAWTLRGLAK